MWFPSYRGVGLALGAYTIDRRLCPPLAIATIERRVRYVARDFQQLNSILPVLPTSHPFLLE